MKSYSILILALITVLLSCNTGNNNSQQTQPSTAETVLNKTEVSPEIKKQETAFNWGKSTQAKEKLVSALQSKNNIDQALVNFIDEYAALENVLNEQLYGLSNYDSLNTLAYSKNGVINAQALEFKEQAEQNGFSIAQAEGTIYLSINPTGIKDEIIALLNSPANEFFNLYCNEIDTKCCADGAIVIPEKELVFRALHWGNLLENTQDLAYNDKVQVEFKKYLSLIFIGIDNTPSFEWSTGKYNTKLFDAMIEVIKEYPESEAAQEFKVYTELLTAESFKRTNKVDAYLKETI